MNWGAYQFTLSGGVYVVYGILLPAISKYRIDIRDKIDEQVCIPFR